MPLTLSRRDGYKDKDGIVHREAWFLYRHVKESLGGFYEPIGKTQYYWSVVKDVSLATLKTDVVDLTIEGTSTFVSKLGAVHNCDWKSRSVVFTARELCRVWNIDFSWRLRLSATESDVEASESRVEKVVYVPAGLPPEYEPFSGSDDEIELKALSYLRSRGISQDEIDEYKIGYAVVGDFAWRVLFPVVGEDGEVYGCAGRDFSGQSKLKYRNTEGIKLLFNGQHKAKRAVVVEGPVDTLAVNRVLKREFRSTVAVGVLGSDLTSQQLAQLMKYDAVINFPDSDAAGVKGAIRRCEICAEAGIETFIIEPETMDGSDPGSMGEGSIAQCIRMARPWSLAEKMRMRLRALR
jgi:hypothetical protein